MPLRRPVVPLGLSIAGGIVVLIVGAWLLHSAFGMYHGGIIAGPLGILGIITGVLIVVGSILAYLHSRGRAGWGLAIVILSGVSFIGLGGLVVGAVLGIIGGALFVAWRHILMGPWSANMCPDCGTQISISYAFCPVCGRRLHTPQAMQQSAYLYYQPAQQYPQWPQVTRPIPNTCRYCVSELPETSKFCHICGAPRVKVKK